MSAAPATGRRSPARPLASPHRHVRTAELMGTVASAHVLTVDSPADGAVERISAAQDAALDELHRLDALFSPFRSGSEISQLRDGGLRLEEADPLVREVFDACTLLAAASGGRFDAARQGWFDPTGYVKGWAVERAAAHLTPLLAEEGIVAAGLSAGGDMQLHTAPGADWTWNVGIVDARRPGALRARLPLRDGAVASSGPGERGAHIVDPRTGAPIADAATATVLAARLSDADAWATIAVVAGFDDLSWLRRAPDTSGMLQTPDGRIRRWTHGVEVGPSADALLTVGG
ncbi:thiamine biosynthesis lipoprotein [Microbacterium azadirachtae]|uniref:FAD:protein FMN transferase n=1 Tax=Microbacterium azadirachtae TaxID=582680 RepID=A0A1I6INN2_9MICO|nr:FAD:protein FMN transferase [Microbacterium azadirachtae]SFR68343.1 thiamine biosynthesis lipoprotein [Microbacterium azadirachtae]